MKQFFRIMAIIFTIVVLVGVTYFLIKYNKEYTENNPKPSGETKVSIEKPKEKAEVTIESKEAIEQYAKEEKDSLISGIKSSINLNTIANVRKTTSEKIKKAQYGEMIVWPNDSGEKLSGDNSGKVKEIQLPETILCNVQVAGSMINIVPVDSKLDSIEFHYRGDNKLIAYIRKFAGTNIKVTYYFENGELLDKEINTFDQRYNVAEDTANILKRADENYNAFLKEE